MNISHFKIKFFLFVIISVFFFGFTTSAFAATKYWVGTASGTTTNSSGNWSTSAGACGASGGAGVPSSIDDIVFTSSCLNSATIDATLSVASFTVNAGYTGTITQKTNWSTGTTTVTGNFIMNAGTYTHFANSMAETYRVNISVGGVFTLVSGATISANGLGHIGSNGAGACVSSCGSSSYGGSGLVNTNIGSGLTYGSITAPTNIGSGSADSPGAGGAVLLNVTGTSTVNGTITANGSATTWGTSGGSVYVRTGTISGTTGILRANGSTGSVASGGGGRVSVVLTQSGADFSSYSGTMTAYGGSGTYAGAAGTVYKETEPQAAGGGTLIIDNNNVLTHSSVNTLMNGTVDLSAFSQIIIQNKGNLGINTGESINLASNNLSVTSSSTSFLTIQSGASVTVPSTFSLSSYTLVLLNIALSPTSDITVTSSGALTLGSSGLIVNGDVTVNSGGLINHVKNYATETYKATLTVSGDLVIDSGGAISANEAGYTYWYGSGTCYTSCGSSSYGGSGLKSTNVGYNLTYGSITAPINIGSGSSEGTKSAGGALILTVTGTTTINGTASANAAAATTYGASGGSVYITTGNLTGSGSMTASGASATTYGGGGGRVAVILTQSGADFSTYSGTMTAYGGAGTYRGAAGTIYRETLAQGSGKGSVEINNSGSTLSTVFTNVSTAATVSITPNSLSLPAYGSFVYESNDTVTFSTTTIGTTISGSSTASFLSYKALEIPGTTSYLGTFNASSTSVTYTGYPSASTTVTMLPGTVNQIVTSNVTSGITYKLNGNVIVTQTYTIPCNVTLDLNGANWQGTIDSSTNAGCGAVLTYNGGSINGISESGGSVTVCSGTGNISAGTYASYSITGNGTICTLAGNVIATSTVTIGNGSTLYLAGYALRTANLTINSGGTLKLKGEENLLVSGTVTNNGTVTYIGNGNSAADTYLLKSLEPYKNLLISFTDTLDTLMASYKTALNTAMVAWWKLDESATPALDSGGYGTSGTWTGSPTATTSVSSTFKFNNARAMVFGGANQYLNIANSTNYAITGDMTISLWVKVDSTMANLFAPIITKRDASDYTSPFALLWDDRAASSRSKQIRLSMGGGGSTATVIGVDSTISSYATWYHVLVTVSGTTMSLYVNNSLIGTATFSGTRQTNSVPLRLAGQYANGSNDYFFKGSIDDVRIYSRALTADEIYILANGYPNEGVANASTTVSSAFTQSAGTFVAPTTLNVAGNFTKSAGTFTPNSGTVVLNGTSQSIVSTGTTTFSNLTKTVSSAATLTFPSGSSNPIVITGTTTLQGAPNQLLSLRSDVTNTPWRFDPQGARTFAYLDVKDSNNISSTTINGSDYDGLVDSGNNTNWTFNSASLTVTATGTQTRTTAMPVTDKYMGGAFHIMNTSGVSTITSIRLTQNGSLDTDYIDDVELRYSPVVSGNCVNTALAASSATLFGHAGLWSGGSATTTGTLAVGETPVCVYILFSLNETLDADLLGSTIDLEISNPSTDVISADVVADPTTRVNIQGPHIKTTVSGTITTEAGTSTPVHFSLTNPDGTSTRFQVIDGKLYKKVYAAGNGGALISTQNLTAADLTVTSARFTRVGDNGIRIEMTLQKTTVAGSIENYTVEKTFRTTSIARQISN